MKRLTVASGTMTDEEEEMSDLVSHVTWFW